MTGKAVLTPADLMMVLLVCEEAEGGPEPATPLSQVGTAVREVADLGMIAIKFFTSGDRRDCQGSQGKARDSLMARAVDEAKSAAPGVIVITEACMCSYTDTGECYLTNRNGLPDRLGTIEAIAEQAVSHANAGADLIGPAAMNPGGIDRIRKVLDESGHYDIGIMPHITHTSRLHGTHHSPRRAMAATRAQRTHQLDSAPTADALKIAMCFVDAGADMLLLEPALFTADLLIPLRQVCPVPFVPFSVPSEHTRLRVGDDLHLLMEFFTMLKRAGADHILTCAATDIARRLS